MISKRLLLGHLLQTGNIVNKSSNGRRIIQTSSANSSASELTSSSLAGLSPLSDGESEDSTSSIASRRALTRLSRPASRAFRFINDIFGKVVLRSLIFGPREEKDVDKTGTGCIY
jgi:hypothetical protein